MSFIHSNIGAISAIVALIVSEALPLLPTKYNGILHIVLDLIKVKKA